MLIFDFQAPGCVWPSICTISLSALLQHCEYIPRFVEELWLSHSFAIWFNWPIGKSANQRENTVLDPPCPSWSHTGHLTYWYDNFFTSHLLKAVKLTYLDISGAKATSLTFLNHLGNLETLILDTCELIQDKDLFPLKTVPKLTHLYLGFMNVTPRGIIKALPEPLKSLDCSGGYFSEEELITVLDFLKRLTYITVYARSFIDILSLDEEYKNCQIIVHAWNRNGNLSKSKKFSTSILASAQCLTSYYYLLMFR